MNVIVDVFVTIVIIILFNSVVDNVKIVTTTLLLQKTNVYSFAVPYNLSFDTYYNLIFNNIQSETKNNNNSQSDFKLPINSLTNAVNFSNELTSSQQNVTIIDKNLTLSKLDVILTDRFNNMLIGNLDWSISLEYEFH